MGIFRPLKQYAFLANVMRRRVTKKTGLHDLIIGNVENYRNAKVRLWLLWQNGFATCWLHFIRLNQFIGQKPSL